MKSYGVTMQMRPLQQYFHMVLFRIKYFTKRNLGFVLNFDFRHSLESKGLTLIKLIIMGGRVLLSIKPHAPDHVFKRAEQEING